MNIFLDRPDDYELRIIKEKYFLIGFETMSNEYLRRPNLTLYILQFQKESQSLIASHKTILLHITELRFCHINGSLMGRSHIKDWCVLICVALMNASGTGNFLSGQQIL